MPRSQLLAYAVANMAGIGGYDGWRWIFIIEGLATIVLAIFSKFIIADWPETAKFLTPAERELAIRRTDDDSGGGTMDRLDRRSQCRIFLDWKIWVGLVLGCRYAVLHSIRHIHD